MLSADRASFFNLARTFSLPGMTMYSVSKSLSMSTPSVLLGRSLTCPSEASTVKPLPRYFWMVFALAGDSTMTKPLDNSSSFITVLEFDPSTKLAAATSYRAKASRSLAPSTQLKSDSAEVGRERQHSLHLEHLPLQIVELIGSKKLQIFGEQQGVVPLRPPNREQLEGTSSSRDLISDHTLRQCSLR